MREVAIRVEGLSKRYRIGSGLRYKTLRESLTGFVSGEQRPWRRRPAETIWALRDVSFEVPQGEVIGIIGRNGAGKSTLLKILARITEPTEGRVEVRGRVGSLLEVGTGFHMELTGRENIYLNGAILGMTRVEIERKFDEIVAFAEIDQFLDTPVKRYSTGMYLRLAFAVAAHLEAEILLVDEVLAVGDAQFQKKCLGKMGDVAKGGRTVLYVSHNLGSVQSLCSRALMLKNGKTLADDNPQSVIDQYVSDLDAAHSTGPWHDQNNQGYLLWGPSQPPTLVCGRELVLKFRIKAPRPVANPTVGIVIHDAAGTPILGASSKWQRQWGNGIEHDWAITCSFGDFPLNSGAYRVSVWLGNPDSDLAKFPEALAFYVEEGDPFGFGASVPRSWGYLYWKPKWQIERGSGVVCSAHHDNDPN